MGIPKTLIDYSLYLVTDRDLAKGRDLLEIIAQAVAGGVTIVQLREKQSTTRDFLNLARRAKEFLAAKKVPLIINDRLDIALVVDADGVHVGADDMPISDARRLLGEDKIIGASVFTPEEAIAAQEAGADYLGLSPIFVTPTKPELTEQIGIEGIPAIRQAARIPIVGIGGINETNAYAVVTAGLDGVAVVSGIVARPDPQAAAKAIKTEVMRAKGRHLNGIAPGELS